MSTPPVRVVLPAALRQHAGGSSVVEVQLPAGSALGALLDALADMYPALERRIRDEQGELRRFVNLYVGEEDVRRLRGLATPVPAGAEILVLPSVAGGCS